MCCFYQRPNLKLQLYAVLYVAAMPEFDLIYRVKPPKDRIGLFVGRLSFVAVFFVDEYDSGWRGCLSHPGGDNVIKLRRFGLATFIEGNKP